MEAKKILAKAILAKAIDGTRALFAKDPEKALTVLLVDLRALFAKFPKEVIANMLDDTRALFAKDAEEFSKYNVTVDDYIVEIIIGELIRGDLRLEAFERFLAHINS